MVKCNSRHIFFQLISCSTCRCLGGLIQILFGMAPHVWNRSRLFGWLYGLSSLGWILAITGGLLSVGDGTAAIKYGAGQSAGLALIIFFSDPGKGLLSRFGLGLWDLW